MCALDFLLLSPRFVSHTTEFFPTRFSCCFASNFFFFSQANLLCLDTMPLLNTISEPLLSLYVVVICVQKKQNAKTQFAQAHAARANKTSIE